MFKVCQNAASVCYCTDLEKSDSSKQSHCCCESVLLHQCLTLNGVYIELYDHPLCLFSLLVMCVLFQLYTFSVIVPALKNASLKYADGNSFWYFTHHQIKKHASPISTRHIKLQCSYSMFLHKK